MLSKNSIKELFPNLKLREYMGNIYIPLDQNELKQYLKQYKIKKNEIPQSLLSGSRTRRTRYLSIDIYKINNSYCEMKHSEKYGAYLRELKG